MKSKPKKRTEKTEPRPLGGGGVGEGVEAEKAADPASTVLVLGDTHTLFRVDLTGRLQLTEHANAFLAVQQLPEDDGGGYAAWLKADPQNLVGDGETVPEALEDLGARCARFARKSPRRPAATWQPPAWTYRRKSQDEIKRLAREIASGAVTVGHGAEAIEASWPLLVAELRAGGLNEAMNRAGVVAFYEETKKAQSLPGAGTTFVSADTLDDFDWERLKQAIESTVNGRREDRVFEPWTKTAAKALKVLARTPKRFLLAFAPRP